MPQGVRAAASAGAALVCLLLSQWVGVCAGSATLLGEPLHVTYVVSGAGSASVDGRYIQLDTMTNGAWHFVMLTDGPDPEYQMYSTLAFRNSLRLWFIGETERDSNSRKDYYWSTTGPSVVYPPSSGWTTETTVGMDPVPAVAQMGGRCFMNGTCVCDAGLYGRFCTSICNATLVCSGHGQCNTGSSNCSCTDGFTGPACELCGPVIHTQPGVIVTLPRGVWRNGHCDCDSGYSGTMCSVETAPWWKFWRWFSTRDYVLAGGSLIVAVLLCMTCYCCNCCCCCCQRTPRRATGKADAKTRLMPRSGDGLESVKRTNSRRYDAISSGSDGTRRNLLVSEDINGSTSFHDSGGRDAASLASPPLSSSGGMVGSGTGAVDAAVDDGYIRHRRLPADNIGESVRVAYLSPPSGSRRTGSRPYTRIRQHEDIPRRALPIGTVFASPLGRGTGGLGDGAPNTPAARLVFTGRRPHRTLADG